jgi:hypothetical protein
MVKINCVTEQSEKKTWSLRGVHEIHKRGNLAVRKKNLTLKLNISNISHYTCKGITRKTIFFILHQSKKKCSARVVNIYEMKICGRIYVLYKEKICE